MRKITQLYAVGIALAWAGVLAAQGQIASQTAGQAAGLVAAQAVAPVAAKRPMTFADLMAIKRVSDPQISPSGRWVMFSVTEVSLEKNTKVNHLWVVALAGAGEVSPTDTPFKKTLAAFKDQERAKANPEKQVTFGAGETFGRFSPDGRWVSYSLGDQIYLAPWDEAAGKVGEARALTSVEGGADGAIWSPDSKRLMFTSQVYPECSVKGKGKRSTNAGILRSAQNDNVKGEDEIEPATWAEEDACDKAKDDAAAASPVKGQVWDELFYRHWDQYTGKKRSHILVVDTDGKNARDLTPASAVGDAETPTWFLGAPLQYAWAPDSKEIAYVTNLDPVPAASTNNDVFTLRLDEPGAKAVKVSTSPGSDDEPEYSPDGKWLAFRSQKQAGFESDRFRLMLFDRAAKKTNEVELTMKDYTSPGRPKESDLDRWVDEFTWVDDSKHILFVAGDHGEEPIYETNITGDDLHRYGKAAGEWSEIKEVLSNGRVVIVGSLMRVDRPTVIAVADPLKMDDSARTFTVALDRSAPTVETAKSSYEPRVLTHVNEDLLSQIELPKMESFWFAGAEGTKVQGFILRPPGFDPEKKYPVKFVMHGGPQTALGDSWSYRWNWELMAASGYVVVGINRRGSTGYGQKFIDEVSGDWGGRAYVDLMKGLDYAEEHYPFIDKTRECALGASYGGFMADWILTHNDRFRCIVTHDGMVDPVSAYGTTEEMWFNEWEFRRPEDFPAGWDGFAPTSQNRDVGHSVGKGEGHPATPWRYAGLAADQDPFRKWSAMRFIQNAKTPTLIIHSQKDYRLDVSQGFELYTALQRQGVPSRFLYFPDEGHWVLKPQNSQLWYETISDWCDRWTKTGKYMEK